LHNSLKFFNLNFIYYHSTLASLTLNILCVKMYYSQFLFSQKKLNYVCFLHPMNMLKGLQLFLNVCH